MSGTVETRSSTRPFTKKIKELENEKKDLVQEHSQLVELLEINEKIMHEKDKLIHLLLSQQLSLLKKLSKTVKTNVM